MKRITTISILMLAALAACTSNQSNPETNQASNPVQAKPVQAKPAKSQVLGMIEVEVSSASGAISSAKILTPERSGLQAQGTAVAISNSNFVLTPGTTTYMTDATYKYFQNTLSFNNKTGINFANLAMYPVSLPSSVGGTAFTAVKTLAGVTLTGTTASDLARATLPTHGMSSTTAVDPAKADLMLYTPAEATTVKSQLTVAPFSYVNPTVLEYGFLGRNLTGGRAVGSSTVACPTCGKGTVTWAFKFPLYLPDSSDLGKFVFRYVIVNEPGSFKVQSEEDQNAQPIATVAGLTSGFGSGQVRTLLGSRLPLSLPGLNPICNIRTAVGEAINNASDYWPYGATPYSLHVDRCFGINGTSVTTGNNPGSGGYGSTVLVQPDGKILAGGGLDSQLAFVRYNPNGTLDTSFGINGVSTISVGAYIYIRKIQLNPLNNKIVVLGTHGQANEFVLIRLNPNGILDTSFGPAGSNGILIDTTMTPTDLKIQSLDGKILVGGNHYNDQSRQGRVMCFDANGSPVTTFGSGGTLIETAFTDEQSVNALEIQSDGKILVVRAVGNYGYGAHPSVMRYLSNGSPDVNFNQNTVQAGVSLLGNGSLVAVKAQGSKVFVFGETTYPESFHLMRLNSDGTVDTSFGTNGEINQPAGTDGSYYSRESYRGTAMALQSNGQVVALGTFHSGSYYQEQVSVRYAADGSGYENVILPSIGVGGLAIHPQDGKIYFVGAANGIAVTRVNP